MAVVVAMLDELKFIALFASIYCFEKLFLWILKASPLIGQILCGLLLGPAFADIVPHVKALRLVGKLGVMLLVVESGLSVDVEKVKSMGLRAFMAAFMGVITPVLLTLLVLSGFWGEDWKTGLTAGAALAPTSLGFSAQLLSEVGQLNSNSGQLVCAAAVIDDVLALLLLSEIQTLQGDDIRAWAVLRPLLASFGSIGIGTFLTVALIPSLQRLKKAFPQQSTRHRVYLLSLFALATSFAFLSALVGSSDLLGCFLAGLVFSTEPEVVETWKNCTSQLVRWGAALFFAATIGFGVPSLTASGGLFEGAAIARGIVLSIVAIIGKFAVGPFSTPLTSISFMKFAWAMIGRGEFSFLIADQAFQDQLISSTIFSAVVWALLISSFLAPFGFRYYLNLEKKKATHEEEVQTFTPVVGNNSQGNGGVESLEPSAAPAAYQDITTDDTKFTSK